MTTDEPTKPGSLPPAGMVSSDTAPEGKSTESHASPDTVDRPDATLPSGFFSVAQAKRSPADGDVGPTGSGPGDRDSILGRDAETVIFTGSSPGKTSAVSALRIPGYELLERLGLGGMGVVFRARQLAANRIVAVKVIRPDVLSGHSEDSRQRMVERFHQEAQAAARIQHDHMVTVYQQFPAEQKDARFPEKTAACTAGGSQVFGGKW